ncbi:MAG: hypothetical protein H0Z31_06805 [Bacillus sp. (in: Bacteria)]|nr:hypothetical protein [Bacillus sp. (in: firmicutes)]
MENPKKLQRTVDWKLVSREGLDLSTNSDYEFHKDVMEEKNENDNKDNDGGEKA